MSALERLLLLAATGKVSKPSVHYRSSVSIARRCGTCDMFRAGSCTLVLGSIDPHHVCDRWEAKK